MRIFLIFCIIWLLLYISACSSQIEQAETGPLIAPIVLSAPIEVDNSQAISSMSTEELLKGYMDVEEQVKDESKKRGIQLRVADLHLRQAEDFLIDGGEQAEIAFLQAITFYEQLLSTSSDSDERIRLQYQLSKAYTLAGRRAEASSVLEKIQSDKAVNSNEFGSDGVNSDLNGHLKTESRFRLAEEAFNDTDYEVAQNLYEAVLQDNGSNFQQSAQYMLGWTEFKRSRYQTALEAFIAVLDSILEEDILQGSPDLEMLPKAERNLVEDSLRAMAIAFSYMGGVASIRETLAQVGSRQYSHLLYNELGTLYRSQDRYRDAAETYLGFVEAEPFSLKAPEFSLKAIDIYYQGNFPSLILDAKRGFVDRYGYNSLFWLAHIPEDLKELKTTLHEYLQELASHHHALAQIAVSEPKEIAENQKNLLLAADYYNQFVLAFPEDPLMPEKAFLKAEALFEAQSFVAAAEAYRFVGYDINRSGLDHSQNESYERRSAYNYILAIDEVLATELDEFERQARNKEKLESLLLFANSYPEDVRAQAVLAQALDLQFNNQEYHQVINIADRLRTWPQPSSDPERLDEYLEITRHTTFVSAQSQFVLGNYFAAEMLFRQLLEDLPADDPRVADSEYQIAVSLYRQAELLEEKTPGLAIDRYITSANFLPKSEVGTTARFDAANLLMQEEQWQSAIDQFLQFFELYPEHELTADIPAKLAVLYQQTGQWKLAADNLLILALAEQQDAQLQSSSIYMAAEFYLKTGEKLAAKNTFQNYVEEYAESQLMHMEAQYQLIELSEGAERNRWIQRLAHTRIMESDRERYLSAWANSELADSDYQRFAEIKLSLPLDRSLKVKQEAMHSVLERYTALMAFGVAEFTTLASYRMGEVYASLSEALLESERPDGLDALALEQYEILLEEQSFPFEEKAIEFHEANARRSWDGLYDRWVQQSIASLGRLMPARYNKAELVAEVSHGIH